MEPSMEFKVSPIGYLHCENTEPYHAPRQASLQANSGYIELLANNNFEQALEDMDGITHIWLIFQFHQNSNWKPKVLTPRISNKVGLFATRSPYRPNPIGISAVKVSRIEGLRIYVENHDLLDRTPILDIKPYLPYSDSIPEAEVSWLENASEYKINFDQLALKQIEFLKNYGFKHIYDFCMQQLSFDPFNSSKKRVASLAQGQWQIAYRTWRIEFEQIPGETAQLLIKRISSGYSDIDLSDSEDKYSDKAAHRHFKNAFT
jgi:tRNA (adenine37-N6)-methyltransferase